MASHFGGWALLVFDGKPEFAFAFSNQQHKYRIASPQPLGPGKHTIRMDFAYDGGGIGKGGAATLSVDGKEAAKGRIEKTVPYRFSLDEGLDVGQDNGTPVNFDYDVPFMFTGGIEKVTIDLEPETAIGRALK